MRLTLEVPDKLYARLLSDKERRALESDLSWLLGWARIDEMLCDGKEWRRGQRSSGNGKLTEAAVDAMMCPLDG